MLGLRKSTSIRACIRRLSRKRCGMLPSGSLRVSVGARFMAPLPDSPKSGGQRVEIAL